MIGVDGVFFLEWSPYRYERKPLTDKPIYSLRDETSGRVFLETCHVLSFLFNIYLWYRFLRDKAMGRCAYLLMGKYEVSHPSVRLRHDKNRWSGVPQLTWKADNLLPQYFMVLRQSFHKKIFHAMQASSHWSNTDTTYTISIPNPQSGIIHRYCVELPANHPELKCHKDWCLRLREISYKLLSGSMLLCVERTIK